MAKRPSNKHMNDLLREARGVTLPEPKTERDKKAQHDEMNRRLREAAGYTVNNEGS
jgi:hypothetical protein